MGPGPSGVGRLSPSRGRSRPATVVVGEQWARPDMARCSSGWGMGGVGFLPALSLIQLLYPARWVGLSPLLPPSWRPGFSLASGLVLPCIGPGPTPLPSPLLPQGEAGPTWEWGKQQAWPRQRRGEGRSRPPPPCWARSHPSPIPLLTSSHMAQAWTFTVLHSSSVLGTSGFVHWKW